MAIWVNVRTFLPIPLIYFTLFGCGDPAKELFETAQFEEKQHNLAHAQELYEQIVKQYPQSEVAKQADTRLAQLKQDQNPVQ